jgi:small subunit ribosomal protein S17e
VTIVGRIKTQQIKSKGDELFELHGREYSASFEDNKEKVHAHATVRSKKLRNVLAGYLTRKARKASRSD